MEVSCEFLDVRTADSTKTIADRAINASGVGNFKWKIDAHLTAGNVIALDDDEELIVVGGRRSICEAFGQNPVANYIFAATGGKVLYASHAASSRKRWAYTAAGMRMMQVISAPASSLVPATAAAFRNSSPRGFAANYAGSVRQAYSTKVNRAVAGVVNQAAKTRTVLHLFSESADFGGHALGPQVTGAGLSLQLARFFA